MRICQPMLSRVQGTAYSLLPICLQAANLESRLAEAAADQEQLRQRCTQLEVRVSSDSWSCTARCRNVLQQLSLLRSLCLDKPLLPLRSPAGERAAGAAPGCGGRARPGGPHCPPPHHDARGAAGAAAGDGGPAAQLRAGAGAGGFPGGERGTGWGELVELPYHAAGLLGQASGCIH